MGQYSDEEKRASIARARALLQRLADDDAARAFDDGRQNLPAHDSTVQTWGMAETESARDDRLYRYGLPLANRAGRWRRDGEERETTRNPGTIMTDAEWAAWADARIAAALEEHARATEKAVGEALGTVREQLRDEIKTAVGELRGEFNIAKAHERGGPIIDLPALPLRRRSNAA